MRTSKILDDTAHHLPLLKPWLVCLSAALFFFYEFIQMGMFNSISPEIMHDFHRNAGQLGTLSATYFYGDVFFLFFAGILLDRFSIRKIILYAMGLAVISTFLFAISPNIQVAAISHFLAGVGNAFCFLSCIKLATRWFPTQRLAFVVGVIVTIGMAGGVVAQTPLTLLVQHFGWREAVIIDGLLGIVLTLIICFFVKDAPLEKTQKIHRPVEYKPVSLATSIKSVLGTAQNWLGGFYTCLMNLPIFLLGEFLGSLYLMQIRHLTRTEASVVTSLLFIGTIVGSPIVGWISDKLKRRVLPMLIGAILSLFTIISIMFIPHLGYIDLLSLFFLLGFFTSTQIITYPLIAESNPYSSTGTSTGLAAVLIMGGGAVFQPLFGWLVDWRWDHHLINGVAVYSVSNFLYGLAIMPIAILLGLIASFCLEETYCEAYKSRKKIENISRK